MTGYVVISISGSN